MNSNQMYMIRYFVLNDISICPTAHRKIEVYIRLNFINVIKSDEQDRYLFSVQLLPKELHLNLKQHLESCINAIEEQRTKLNKYIQTQASSQFLLNVQHASREIAILLFILRLYNDFETTTKTSIKKFSTLSPLLEEA